MVCLYTKPTHNEHSTFLTDASLTLIFFDRYDQSYCIERLPTRRDSLEDGDSYAYLPLMINEVTYSYT